jgi:hypothetical protein
MKMINVLAVAISLFVAGCGEATTSTSKSHYDKYLNQEHDESKLGIAQTVALITDSCIGIEDQDYIIRITDAGYDVSGVKAYGRFIWPKDSSRLPLVIIDPAVEIKDYAWILSHEGQHILQMKTGWDLTRETELPHGERSYEIDANYHGIRCFNFYQRELGLPEA